MVLFAAKVPSAGNAVYDLQPTATSNSRSTLTVTKSSIENDRYRVRLDQNGDVSSSYDKSLKRSCFRARFASLSQRIRPRYIRLGIWNLNGNRCLRAPTWEVLPKSASRRMDLFGFLSRWCARRRAQSSYRPSAFPQAMQAIGWSSATRLTGELRDHPFDRLAKWF